MANEIRRLYNFFGGEVQENPLLAAATSMTNPAFVALPVVPSTQHVPLTFDPDGDSGAPFVKWITAHTAGSDIVTITATAQESWANGGTERDIPQGTPFVLAATQVDMPGQPGGMGLLGVVAHNPTTAASYTTTSATFVDIDATNLKYTFLAPPTGKVLHRLTGTVNISTSTAALLWGLRDATGFISRTGVNVQANNLNQKLSAVIIETGLTPGQSYERRWAWRSHSSSFTSTMYAGGPDTGAGGAEYGASSMEAWAVNF